MSQTLTKPILLDETGQAIKTALQNIDETEAQDWLLTYEDVHSELDDNMKKIADNLESIKNIMLTGKDINIPNWSDGTDEEIVEAIRLHYAGEIDLTKFWSIGDTRTVHLSAMSDSYDTGSGTRTIVSDTHVAQDVELVLMHPGGFTLKTKEGIPADTECLFVVGMKDVLLESGYMNADTETTITWDTCARREWCNNIFRYSLPTELQKAFKEFRDYYSDTSSYDWFAIPAEKNICDVSADGSSATSISGQFHFKYYEISTNRAKYGKFTRTGNDDMYDAEAELASVDYFTGDKFYQGAKFFVGIDKTFLNGGAHRMNYRRGLSPFGCI